MAPDWMYDAAAWFQRFMDGASGQDLLIGAALTFAATPLLILLHEVGHALAVLARGLPLRQLKVGHTADFAVDLGPLRVELGRLTGASPVGGFVRFDGRRGSPMDLLVIALAGPIANVLGAIATGFLAYVWWGHGQLTIMLVLMTIEGVWMTVGNLRPFESSDGPEDPSDGRIAQLALAELRQTGRTAPRDATGWPDPHAETSVAPPPR